MTHRALIAGAAVLGLLGGGYYLWRRKKSSAPHRWVSPFDLLDPYPDDAATDGCIFVDEVRNTTTGETASGDGRWYCGDDDPPINLPGNW